jgi:predicted GIY-YIG superfamily endonuclease
MPSVYLLHFSRKLGKQSQHYCGQTPTSLRKRITAHKQGRGACITRACIQQGIKLIHVRTWHVDTAHDARILERALKDSHNLSYYCPRCSKGKKRTPSH